MNDAHVGALFTAQFLGSVLGRMLAAVLISAFASISVWDDQSNAILFSELRVERFRFAGLISDEPCREIVEQAFGKNLFCKLALGTRSALDIYSVRKSAISGNSDNLCALAVPRQHLQPLVQLFAS